MNECARGRGVGTSPVIFMDHRMKRWKEDSMDWTIDKETETRIFAEAVRWVDTLDRAGINLTEFLRWSRHSPGHLGALCEALELWEDIRVQSDSRGQADSAQLHTNAFNPGRRDALTGR